MANFNIVDGLLNHLQDTFHLNSDPNSSVKDKVIKETTDRITGAAGKLATSTIKKGITTATDMVKASRQAKPAPLPSSQLKIADSLSQRDRSQPGDSIKKGTEILNSVYQGKSSVKNGLSDLKNLQLTMSQTESPQARSFIDDMESTLVKMPLLNAATSTSDPKETKALLLLSGELEKAEKELKSAHTPAELKVATNHLATVKTALDNNLFESLAQNKALNQNALDSVDHLLEAAGNKEISLKGLETIEGWVNTNGNIQTATNVLCTSPYDSTAMGTALKELKASVPNAQSEIPDNPSPEESCALLKELKAEAEKGLPQGGSIAEVADSFRFALDKDYSQYQGLDDAARALELKASSFSDIDTKTEVKNSLSGLADQIFLGTEGKADEAKNFLNTLSSGLPDLENSIGLSQAEAHDYKNVLGILENLATAKQSDNLADLTEAQTLAQGACSELPEGQAKEALTRALNSFAAQVSETTSELTAAYQNVLEGSASLELVDDLKSQSDKIATTIDVLEKDPKIDQANSDSLKARLNDAKADIDVTVLTIETKTNNFTVPYQKILDGVKIGGSEAGLKIQAATIANTIKQLDADQGIDRPNHDRLKSELIEAKTQTDNRLVELALDSVSIIRGESYTLENLNQETESGDHLDPSFASRQEKIKNFANQKNQELNQNLETLVDSISFKAPEGDQGKFSVTGQMASLKAGLADLKNQSTKLLLAEDQKSFNEKIDDIETRAREALPQAFMDNTSASQSLHDLVTGTDPKVDAETADKRQKALDFIVGQSLADGPLIAALSIEGNKEETVKLLDSLGTALASSPPDTARLNDAFQALDNITANKGLTGITLDLKLALANIPESGLDPETIKIGHLNTRIKEELFEGIKASGKEGRSLLNGLDIKNPQDLTPAKMSSILEKMDDGPVNAFNLLMVKSLWHDYLITNGTTDTDANLDEFKKTLPKNLGTMDNGALRGQFALGYSSTAELAETAQWIERARESTSLFDMGLIMDKFLAGDDKFRAREALTISVRNILDSNSITYKPEEDNLESLVKALSVGFKDKLNTDLTGAESLAHYVGENFRREAGYSTKTAQANFDMQLTQALASFQRNSPDYKNVQQLQKQLDLYRNILSDTEKNILNISPDDLNRLQSKAFSKLPKPGENPELRDKLIADPLRFLNQQGALDLETGKVIGKNITGETMGIGLLAFEDVLTDKITGLSSPEQRVSALKSIKLPQRMNIEYMNSGRSSDPEGKNIQDIMAKLQNLNPAQADFEAQYQNLKGQYLGAMETYQLRDKVNLILAYKDSAADVRATQKLPTSKLGQIYDSIVLYKKPFFASIFKAFSNKEHGVAAVGALQKGLRKAMEPVALQEAKKTGPANPGSSAKPLYSHIMNSYMNVRGKGANLGTVGNFAADEARKNVEETTRILGAAYANFSMKSTELLDNMADTAILMAFDKSGLASFSGAQTELAAQGEKHSVYVEAKNILSQMGISDEMSGIMLQKRLMNPISTESLAEKNQLGVLGGIADSASPRLKYRLEDIKVRLTTNSAVKTLENAENMKKRTGVLLDRLTPNTAVNFTGTTTATVGVPAGNKAFSVAAALELTSKSGFGVIMDQDGHYQVVVNKSSGAALGAGVSVDAVLGGMSARAGISGALNDGVIFSLDTREDCQKFLTSMFDGTWTADQAAKSCSGIEMISGHELGAAVGATLSLGKVPLGSNLGKAAFSANFAANAHLETETKDINKAGQEPRHEVTTKMSGFVEVKAGVSVKPNTSNAPKPSEAVAKQNAIYAAQDNAMAAAEKGASEAAGGINSVQVNANDVASIQLGESISLGLDLNIGKLSAEVRATLTASTTSSTIRDKNEPNVLREANFGTSVDFSGRGNVKMLESYLKDELGMPGSVVKEITTNVNQQFSNGWNHDFTLNTSHTLTPEALSRIQSLEVQGKNDEAQTILSDRKNYKLGDVNIDFKGQATNFETKYIPIISRAVSGTGNMNISYNI